MDNVKLYRVKDFVEHQGIGGKILTIDERDCKITDTLTNNNVFGEAMSGNWACKNFVDRRDDFDCDFRYKLYYGHVEGLGYVVAEDEIEEVEE